MSEEDFSDWLNARCKELRLSKYKLAVLCDLGTIYWYQAVNKNHNNPPPWVLKRAARHLKTTYVELLCRAGYLTMSDLMAMPDWMRDMVAPTRGSRS